MTEERKVTFMWDDPMIGANAALELAGLDYLQAMIDGKYPPAPIAVLFNMKLLKVEKGYALFTAEPKEYAYNPIGVVHGGYATTVLDAAMGCAVHTMLPAGTAYSTSHISVHLVRPVTAQLGILSCEGKIVHSGRMVATSEARLVDANGKLYAHSTCTCAIFPVQRG